MIGTTVGPYQVVEKLGAGGMGEVYEAIDTRLSRRVALKVLPRDKSADAGRRQRFEREARAIASVTHPNICTLYDVGSHDGHPFLVMELLEGETLAQRIRRGPLPMEQALQCATEIASALDHAHQRGIVHRDLKPANVMLTPAGVKLLDFGVARLTEASQEADDPEARGEGARSDTLTDADTILGTVQYMAPEQIEAKGTDRRADIFAFGAVVYEMLTGRPAFEGANKASVIVAVLTREPPPLASARLAAAAWPDAASEDVPQALDHVLGRCLAKDPDDRWQTASDLRRELQWIARQGLNPAAAVHEPLPRWAARRWRGILLGLGTAALATILAVVWLQSSAPRPQAINFEVHAPKDATFSLSSAFLTLSPDGQSLVTAAVSHGQMALWLRSLSSVGAQRLAASDSAISAYPFWSPDGRFIGLLADGDLKKIDVSGGPAQVLYRARQAGQTGSWNRDGVILFRIEGEGGLSRISASGGEAMPVTALDASRGEVVHSWPQFLPDGRHFLFVAVSKPANRAVAYVGSLDSTDRLQLIPTDSQVAYAAPGYLLYMQGATLLARPFDANRLRATGGPVAIADQVERTAGSFRGAFSVSDGGVLAYRRIGETRLKWVDRGGRRLSTIGDAGHYANPALAPDDQQLAVSRVDPATGNMDIWVMNLTRGTTTRLTFSVWNDFSLWTPTGSHVIFKSQRGSEGSNIYRRAATATGPEDLVLAGLFDAQDIPYSWTPEGDLVLGARGDLWLLAHAGPKSRHRLLETPFEEAEAVVSPDGRSIAYVSMESGKREVYLSRFPLVAERWKISSKGGTQPAWRRDGRELFYLADDGHLMAVRVDTDPAVAIGREESLFETGVLPLNHPSARNQYAAAADGQRFLVNERAGERSSPVTVVVNWPALLER